MEENYNIFTELHLERKETIHSAMIAAIVAHDKICRDSFFKMLEDKVAALDDTEKKKNFKISALSDSIIFNSKHEWIDTEVHLTEYINGKYRNRGRADIWIGTNNGKNDSYQYRLIIENKISARNQYCQLRKYYRYLTGFGKSTDKFPRNFAGLFFLCVNNNEEYIKQANDSAKTFPSESNGKEKDLTKYAIITYEDDIIPWLCDVLEKSTGSFKKAVGDYLELVKSLVKNQ